MRLLPVPVFQRLERVTGDWPQVEARLAALKAVGDPVWLEVTHTGHEVMDDLRAHDVDIMTMGQYLQPSRFHLPIERYVHPDEFARLKEEGEARGFRWVESGPLVRSSYHADGQAHLSPRAIR